MSFGENGDAYSEPRGRPYHVTGTLKGLPPSFGWIFLLKNGNAG